MLLRGPTLRPTDLPSGSIMTELVPNQRGVSLMLLIIAITVFAAVAIGIVTLLRSRYESYPYQVQSYQAYTLAHAGVEFALGYAKENADNFFQNPV